ncbi:AraC family transcriptional regulator [Microvirga rosea]|nr:AraC family transcriptional regulator [Microvirga rosea]MCB8820466.1 AraC family transcriptional regulator [Microvirga rosea]
MPRAFRMLRSHIDGVDAVMASTSHAFSRHIHDQFGIGVISQGAQKSASGRGPVEAGAGDAITVNPGEVHDGAPIGDRGRSWRMLYISPAVIEECHRDISDGRSSYGEFTHPVITDDRLAHRFECLFSLITSGDEHDASFCEEQLLLLIASTTEVRSSVQDRGIPHVIERAVSLMDDDPTSTVGLSELAQISGLSRFQLLRGFAKATGLTPHAYLVQRRIQLARRLIAEGTPLIDAALASGFADQSHMTRIFKKAYGLSPGAYAAAIR